MADFQAELEFKSGLDQDDNPAPSKRGKDSASFNKYKGRRSPGRTGSRCTFGSGYTGESGTVLRV